MGRLMEFYYVRGQMKFWVHDDPKYMPVTKDLVTHITLSIVYSLDNCFKIYLNKYTNFTKEILKRFANDHKEEFKYCESEVIVRTYLTYFDKIKPYEFVNMFKFRHKEYIRDILILYPKYELKILNQALMYLNIDFLPLFVNNYSGKIKSTSIIMPEYLMEILNYVKFDFVD